MKENIEILKMEECFDKNILTINLDGLKFCNEEMNFSNYEIKNVLNGRVCFTGNRPASLPWGSNENCDLFKVFRANFKALIVYLHSKGYVHFTTGMAMGIDIIAGEIVLEIKEEGKDVLLECAIPCSNQTRRWANEYIKRYSYILARADKITNVSTEPYMDGCFQRRNCYMVDNSDLVLAVSFASKGGTKNTIEYAKKKKKSMIVIGNG